MPYGIEAVSAGELGLAEPDETGTSFPRQRAHQGAAPRQRHPACRHSRTIPASRSMRSMASPASIRRAGPGRTRISGTRCNRRRQVARARRGDGRSAHARISSPRSASPGRTATSRTSRPRSTARWSGRRAATQGFGYDPMFLPDGHARTFGEMTSEEKHGLPPRGKGLSHRARAFLKLAEACLAKR